MQYVIITSLENFAALNNGKPDTGRMSIGSYFHMIGPAHLIANDLVYVRSLRAKVW